MLRFRMSRSDECERCSEVETYKHLFWECRESRKVWRASNEYMGSIGHQNRVTKCYDIKKVKSLHDLTTNYVVRSWVANQQQQQKKTLFCALRPTFEKLYRGVERALRRAPNFNRAISMIRAVRPNFMKSTLGPCLLS